GKFASQAPLAAIASAAPGGSRHSRSWKAKATKAVDPVPDGAAINGAPDPRTSSAAGIAPAVPVIRTSCTGSPPRTAVKATRSIAGRGESWNSVQGAPELPGRPFAAPFARAMQPVANAAIGVPGGTPIQIRGSPANRSAGTGADGATICIVVPAGIGVE